MSDQLDISIPQAAVWLLRLAADRNLADSLKHDPVAFAAWYASVGEVLTWPSEVKDIQKAKRGKRLSLERMMKLLTQVNYTFAGRTNAKHARRVLEGYAVHAWVARNPEAFMALAIETLKSIESLEGLAGPLLERLSPFAARIAELGRILHLSKLEQDILAFAFLATISDELSGVFEQLSADRWCAGRLWTTLFATTSDELSRAMRAGSPLRLSGLLEARERRAQFATVSPFWVELLVRSESLTEALVEPLESKAGSGRPAKLLEEDLTLAVKVLNASDEPGVNLLLYGAPSLDKRELLHQIVKGSERAPWKVRRYDDAPRSVLPSLTFVAFQVLADKHEPSVLVIERPPEVLHTAPSEMIRMLFGIELPSDESLPFDENLLSTNPVPAVWLASSLDSLPEDTIARFVFHAPLKKADRAEQERALRAQLAELSLTEAVTAEILKFDGVSSAQLASAVKAAKLTAAGEDGDRGMAILQAIKRSQRALSRDLSERFKPSVTQYSLEYLNTTGRFTPAEILKSFRKRPKGSVLLYGIPGTGKTQFTEYLASELGRPLVSKSASALLSKWVGESEKNISAAFEEAMAEDAILFFDEGDSFLRSRELAHGSWEVTQTNELLQHMERFDGIVIVATNLFRNLDPAALRRFTFKVEFQALSATQRWAMFIAEAGLAGRVEALDSATRQGWHDRLLFMRHLTPGDFATVKRQSLVLDVELSPEEWLEQLELECAVKSAAPAPEPAR